MMQILSILQMSFRTIMDTMHYRVPELLPEQGQATVTIIIVYVCLCIIHFQWISDDNFYSKSMTAYSHTRKVFGKGIG